MTATTKKILLIGFGIFLTVILGVGVIYMVRKPATVATLPSPTPKPTATAQPAPVFVVTPVVNKCETTFTVACASGSPSPAGSVSPIPSSSPSTPPSASLDCVAKRMYSDDSRNRAGFYYIEQEIVDTNTLQSGQAIVYNIVARNNGGNSAPDTTITDKLSSNLTYMDGDSSCAYDTSTRVVTCTVGALSGNSEASRSFRAKISVSGTTSVANTAEVTSTNGQRDSCSVKIDATGKVVVAASAAPTALPVAGVFEVTAGTMGVGLLLLILGGLGLLLI